LGGCEWWAGGRGGCREGTCSGGRYEQREEERPWEVEEIVEEDEEGDDDALADFEAVDTREDVDAVRCEDRYRGHVGVVEPA